MHDEYFYYGSICKLDNPIPEPAQNLAVHVRSHEI